jgi:circadian clock protein KaiC
MVVDDLERIVPGFDSDRNLVVIKGYPGSGKTTFAATLCEHIARSRGPCVYVSFQEDKDKFFSNTAKLGLSLRELADAGRFRYVNLPVTLDAESFMRFIQDEVGKLLRPGGVLVIDSINPIIKSVPGDVPKRAVLQNFFASLPRIFRSTVVLVSETPEGSEESLGDIDFVADVIFSMKYKVVRGLLTRYLEIKKARGSPTLITEIPFSIRSVTGLTLYPPVILSEIPPVSKEKLYFPCSLLRGYIGGINKGQSIYVTYPTDMRPREVPYLIFGLIVHNNARALVISYRYPPDYIRKVFTEWIARDYGLPPEATRELFDKHVVVESINPLSVSHTELMAKEMDIIRSIRPDVVMFHGTDVFPLLGIYDRDYATNLFNMLQTLAGMGILVIRDSAYVSDEWHKLGSALARAVLHFDINKNGDLVTYIWRGGSKAITVNEGQLHECLDEIVKEIAKKINVGDGEEHP